MKHLRTGLAALKDSSLSGQASQRLQADAWHMHMFMGILLASHLRVCVCVCVCVCVGVWGGVKLACRH